MEKFLRYWLSSALVGLLFGALLFTFWLLLSRSTPQSMVCFFGVIGIVAAVFLLIYAFTHDGGQSFLLGAAMAIFAFYVAGAAFRLDWLVVIGLPAGLESVDGKWLLHIFFGGVYWVAICAVIVIGLVWLEETHTVGERLAGLLYIATAIAAVCFVMHLGNGCFLIV